ncbi:response regulator transcription factor [Pseudomonas syringae group genomosp. 3]|uniref:response regulator transcription factor n=1 Tax=Pseudomonas syringae group genomosp. 3 TaxID=251701 RepID=UPI0006B90CBC|nr:LuxR C-terminal-related transcriptional regulator [Pseudomonas syringae group genomosp. 3]KPB89587.1 LuxR family transcriptional regulator [Pseudomonas syringae pv. maculicola]
MIKFKGLQGTKGVLADQELRTALAICSGLANKEVARALECAPGTVKKTVERIFFKLGVSSRAALVAEAFRRGLISFAYAGNPSPENHRGEDSSQGVFVA